MQNQIIQLRQELHHCPEASMCECRTKQLLMDFIKANTDLAVVDRGSWFYARYGAGDSGRRIAFRADFDALLCGDGKARHLCGHDGHSAALAGFALELERLAPDADVYLLFQPGEETGEGAAICRELIREAHITEIYGFHNIPGYETNQVILRNGTFACASTGMEIRLRGKMSHAAYPENGKNPAPAAAEIIRYMEALIHREHEGVVLGTVIGAEIGGTSYGVSAGDAVLRLTLRAEQPEEYRRLVDGIRAYAEGEAARQGLSCEIFLKEEFPATVNTENCVKKVEAAAEALSLPFVYQPEPFRWSEDFGHYLNETAGAFFGIGCGREHPGLHTEQYEFNDDIIETVIELYKRLACPD